MLRLAKVVNVNPQAHSADVVFMDTGDRVPNVQVQSANISTNSGKLGLHLPTAPPTPYGVQDTGERDVFAWVDFAGSIPVITGFKVPEIGQMTFLESNLEVDRHASDFYRTVSDDGSVEMAWPNGLWMGVQTTPGHVDRTGTDYDGQWKIARNTGASYTTTLGLPDGVGTIQISPAGALTISPCWRSDATGCVVDVQGARHLHRCDDGAVDHNGHRGRQRRGHQPGPSRPHRSRERDRQLRAASVVTR